MTEADLQSENTLKRSELRKFTNSVKSGHEPSNLNIYTPMKMAILRKVSYLDMSIL